MRAIDTNVIVRFLTHDDPVQWPKAQAVIEAGETYVSSGVLLETEWVLRSVHKLPPQEIIASLRAIAGLPGLRIENPELLAIALEWASSGMDLADAFHLAAAAQCEDLLTFDQRFAKTARSIGATPSVHAL